MLFVFVNSMIFKGDFETTGRPRRLCLFRQSSMSAYCISGREIGRGARLRGSSKRAAADGGGWWVLGEGEDGEQDDRGFYFITSDHTDRIKEPDARKELGQWTGPPSTWTENQDT